MEEKKEGTTVNVNSSAFVGSQFAQMVGVGVTDTDVTFDFVFISALTPKQGQVVSRVTVSREVAKSLSESISSTIKKHDDSKKRA